MSRLRDVLSKVGTATPRLQIGTPTTTPQPTAPQVPVTTGNTLQALVNAKKPSTLPASRLHHLPPHMNTAEQSLLDVPVSLTNDMTTWPDDANVTESDAPTKMRTLLEYLKNVLVTEEVSDAMVRCLNFLKDNPSLKDILLPDDVGLLLQALQSSTGIILSEKTARKSKTSARKEAVEKTAGELADLGFGGEDLF
jgi:hypothetical protein